ncbi:MAG TPA: isoprenylcysteine carboxylmethyltransferase family protein [Spirochaetota bacterium]|nr:isoprenylcysteine carboxylmethyltransferase family protein [Spirochaetota bacterium]
MHLTDFIVIGCFIIIFGNMIGTGIIYKLKKVDFKGKPPISPPLYKLSKVSSFFVWFIFLFSAIFHKYEDKFPKYLFYSNEVLQWISVFILAIGTFIFFIAFRGLGDSIKFGLPESENTDFCCAGIYKISRNPMYLSFILIDVGAILFFPNVVTIVLSIIAIWLHHLIALSEERYMEKAFGSAYSAYKKKVRRYI